MTREYISPLLARQVIGLNVWERSDTMTKPQEIDNYESLVKKSMGEPEPEMFCLKHISDMLCDQIGRRKKVSYKSFRADPDALVVLLDHINPAAEETRAVLKAKVEKFKQKAAQADAVIRIIGSVMVTKLHSDRGPEAEQNARDLVDFLFRTRRNEHVTTLPIEEDEQITPLDTEILDKGIWWAMLVDEPGTVANQLNDRFRLASEGLTVSSNEHMVGGVKDYGIEPVQTFLKILDSLQHEESSQVLEKWIETKLSSGGSAEYCVDFLKTLAEFTTFIDSPTFFQLYLSKDAVASLLPFRSLLLGVQKARSVLEHSTGYGSQIQSLQESEKIIRSRFHQIFQGTMKDVHAVTSPDDLNPLMDNIAEDFMNKVVPKIENNQMTIDDAAKQAVDFLSIMGINNFEMFTQILSGYVDVGELNGNDLAQQILVEAIKRNLIDDPDGSTTKDLMIATLQSLKKKQWKDLSEHNLAEVVAPGTEKVEVFLIPGTFGPWTDKAHGDLKNKIIAYVNNLDKQDATEGNQGKIKRIVVIAPNTQVGHTSGTNKSEARTGNVTERVSSILLQNQDVDRSRVFVTTRMLASPKNTKDISAAINAFKNTFSAKLRDQMKSARREATQKVEVVLCCGLDEVYEEEKGGKVKLVTPQKLNRKFAVADKTVLVGRSGFLLPGMRDANRIFDMVGKVDLILTPGTPFTSSSTAVDQLLATGTTRHVSKSALPYVAEHWNSRRVKERRSFNDNGRTPSVGSIYHDLVNEYEKILQDSGVINS